MKVRLVGKERRTGVSKKTGKTYDFVVIHYIAPARGVIGEAAQTVIIDPGLFPFENIAPGMFDLEFDNRGNVLALTAAVQNPAK